MDLQRDLKLRMVGIQGVKWTAEGAGKKAKLKAGLKKQGF
jgi:hypothetical protein